MQVDRDQFYSFCQAGNVRRVRDGLAAANETEKQELLQHRSSDWGNTPLMGASRDGQEEVVCLLLEAGADISEADSEGNTSLMLAASNGRNTCLHRLLEKGADVTAANQFGATALHKAAYLGHTECVRILLEAKANVNTTDHDGNTPVLLAAAWGHESCVKLLLETENAADLTAKNKKGETALFLAAMWGYETEVKMMLDAKCDPLAIDDEGRNLLHVAAQFGDNGSAEVLLGLDRNIVEKLLEFKNKDGDTPLMVAKSSERNMIIKTIEHYKACIELIDLKADLLINEDEGVTGLHVAAEHGWEKVVEVLLHGEDAWTLVNARTKDGDTPLDLATKSNKAEVIQVLKHYYLAPVKIQTVFRGYAARKNINKKFETQHLEYRENKASSVNGRYSLQAAARFAEVAHTHCHDISLDNVMLVSRKEFLEAGSLPHYRRCFKKHFTAAMLKESDAALFVSHRWGGRIHPDPNGMQYELIKDFLESPVGDGIEYIWADYSSVCQDKSSDLFKIDLQNIPTAIWTATHCLIIPNITDDAGIPATDLKDYLNRAWCLLELLASMITGKKCFITFKADSVVYHINISSKPISTINKEVWDHLCAVDFFGSRDGKISVERLFQQWICGNPNHILEILGHLSSNKHPTLQNILEKAKRFEITLDDIFNPEAFELLELFTYLGECLFPDDKVPVINLLIFIWVYHESEELVSEKQRLKVMIQKPSEGGLQVHFQRSFGSQDIYIQKIEDSAQPNVKEGLKVEDKVIGLNGTRFSSSKDLCTAIANVSGGAQLEFEIERS